MNIFVDENIPNMTVEALRNLGHDVRDTRGTPEQGEDDDSLWKTVLAEERLLITTDKGFVRHRGDPHHGLLVARLRQPNTQRFTNA